MLTMLWTLIAFIAIIIVFVMIGLAFRMLVNKRRRAIQAVFRLYNQEDDLTILIGWIQEARSCGRLIEAMEYLHKIRRDDLALEVYDAIGFDPFPDRHLRIMAVKMLRDADREQESLRLAHLLYEAHPGDDSIIEIYLDTLLHFERYAEAEPILNTRLEKKYKGTVFPRNLARVVAAKGDYPRAITIMREVVSREKTLFRNTIAQPQKDLIGEQLARSQDLLAHYEHTQTVEEVET